MKKSLAYVMTAVLLGAVIMILPWASSDAPSGLFSPLGGSENRDTLVPQAAFAGLISPLVFVGLMLAVSLIVALGVYLFSKRRVQRHITSNL